MDLDGIANLTGPRQLTRLGARRDPSLRRVIYSHGCDANRGASMAITKPDRGRPSRKFILEQVDLAIEDLKRTGGLPSPTENSSVSKPRGA